MRRSSRAAAAILAGASALLACSSRTGPSAPPVDTRPACAGPDARLDESRGDAALPNFTAPVGALTTLHVRVTVDDATRLDAATFAVKPVGYAAQAPPATGDELVAVPVPVGPGEAHTAALSFRSTVPGRFPVTLAMTFTTTRDCGAEDPLRDPYTQRADGEVTLGTITVRGE